MTKEKLIETLKAMADNTYACSMYSKDSNPVYADKLIYQWLAYDTVVKMLENDEYAESIRRVYFND